MAIIVTSCGPDGKAGVYVTTSEGRAKEAAEMRAANGSDYSNKQLDLADKHAAEADKLKTLLYDRVHNSDCELDLTTVAGALAFVEELKDDKALLHSQLDRNAAEIRALRLALRSLNHRHLGPRRSKGTDGRVGQLLGHRIASGGHSRAHDSDVWRRKTAWLRLHEQDQSGNRLRERAAALYRWAELGSVWKRDLNRSRATGR